MKHNHHRKSFHKRYKRIAAAMAGAAVISSAMLPGVPVAKVQAEPTQTNDRESAANQTEWLTSSSSPLDATRQYAKEQGYDSDRNNLSLQWKSGNDASVILREDNGNTHRVKLIKDGDNTWRVQNIRQVDRVAYSLRDPVSVVKDNAAAFGFDAQNDRFTLLSMAGSKAVVQVRSGGQTFKVDLVKTGASWDITTIRGIGDMNHSATYTPASFFPATTTSTLSASQSVLYRTNTYDQWDWNQTTYPNDMTLGVVLQNPNAVTTSTIPADIRAKLANVNFNNQFVIFAYLGNVPPHGYGIGIERVVQSANAITVTVHTKSPNNATDLPQTKYSDFITVDRAAINNTDQVHITFVDQTGRTLSNYTIAAK